MSEEATKYEIAEKPQDESTIDGLLRIASGLSKSDMVPKHFQGKATNCFLALQIANRMKLDPFAVMQNLYVVHGTPAFSAKFLIAQANRSGTFKTPIMFEYSGEGDDLTATAWAIHAASDERIEFSFSLADAKAENYTKNPKYKSMPKLMLSYRAATLLCRLYCPETAMGVTVDEVEDMKYAKAEASPAAYEDDGTDIIPDAAPAELPPVVETVEDAEVLPPVDDEPPAAAAETGELI